MYVVVCGYSWQSTIYIRWNLEQRLVQVFWVVCGWFLPANYCSRCLVLDSVDVKIWLEFRPSLVKRSEQLFPKKSLRNGFLGTWSEMASTHKAYPANTWLSLTFSLVPQLLVYITLALHCLCRVLLLCCCLGDSNIWSWYRSLVSHVQRAVVAGPLNSKYHKNESISFV